ncbi:ComF family protein [Pararhodobacter sp.]|uniref:ComF family protein n=1 Tax=Pararhodobacter sp. TaxID=2127056 RepID=UPI002FDD2A72
MQGQKGRLAGVVERAGTTAVRALRLVYPPQCLTCDAAVGEEGTLCPSCWGETPFIAGLVCDKCGIPLPGQDEGEVVLCDDCHRIARPWGRGRAALLYGDKARQIVLGIKYYDRHDTALPAGRWLARAAAPLIRADTLVAPVPLHWWRLFRRRYNQSALLSAALARTAGLDHCPDLLIRNRHTGTQDGRTREGRFANLSRAISVHPRRAGLLAGRHVLLVDDVMTSGATLAAAAEACFSQGADAVDVVALARVGRNEQA